MKRISKAERELWKKLYSQQEDNRINAFWMRSAKDALERGKEKCRVLAQEIRRLRSEKKN